jgi:transcriptional regulator NrdR family protein
MRCPNCNSTRTSVRDSRMSDDGTMRRRRHVCSRGHSFSTYETYASSEIWKSDKNLENIHRLLMPLMQAMQQLPAPKDSELG